MAGGKWKCPAILLQAALRQQVVSRFMGEEGGGVGREERNGDGRHAVPSPRGEPPAPPMSPRRDGGGRADPWAPDAAASIWDRAPVQESASRDTAAAPLEWSGSEVWGAPGRSAVDETRPSAWDEGMVWRSERRSPGAGPQLAEWTPHAAPSPLESRRAPAEKAARRRVRRRRLAAVSVALVLLLGADATWVGVTVRSSLLSTKERLAAAQTAFEAGRFGAARAALHAAISSVGEARSMRWHPAALVAGALPWLNRDVQAVDDLTAAAELAARAGVEAMQAVTSSRSGGGKLADTVYAGGRVNFDAIDQAAPHIASAEALLKRAGEKIALAPAAHFGVIRQVFDNGRAQIDSVTESVRKARSVLAALPTLLGRAADRRYLLAFQSPSEERGTGGIFGYYGVLHATDGRLSLGKVSSIARLEDALTEPVGAPRWFLREYKVFGGTDTFRQTNLSPNFPVVSRVWLEMYQAAIGQRLDGVIAMDPVALSQMMKGTGPLPSPDGPVDADHITAVLMHDSYQLGFRRQNQLIASLIKVFWEKVNTDVDAPAFVAGLSEAVSTQHFKVYSADSEAQAALARVGANGDFRDYGPNVQFMYHNNIGANKVDFYLNRLIDSRVELLPSGDARVSTRITWESTAPSGPPSILLGDDTAAAKVGFDNMLVNFVLPKGSRVKRFAIDGFRESPIKATDSGWRRYWTTNFLPPGKTSKAIIEYVIPNAVDLTEGDPVFQFALYPQASVNADGYILQVLPPPGYVVGATQRSFYRVAGTLDRPVDVELPLRRGSAGAAEGAE